MKFRLSTLMLVIAIACIAGGWAIDRKIQAQRTESLVNGAIAFSESSSIDHLAHAIGQDLSIVPEIVRFHHVKSVFILYRNSSEVNSFASYGDSNSTALSMARDALETMDCTTADAYFDKFGLIYNWDIYNEFKDPNSPEHGSFRSFIERALVDSNH